MVEYKKIQIIWMIRIQVKILIRIVNKRKI